MGLRTVRKTACNGVTASRGIDTEDIGALAALFEREYVDPWGTGWPATYPLVVIGPLGEQRGRPVADLRCSKSNGYR
jgi:hypothetical protein